MKTELPMQGQVSRSINPKAGAKKKEGMLQELFKNRFSYLLIIPAMLYVFVFSYATYPYLIIAFQKFN
ncbi:MAG: putative aldouronate transport system permease protein, partial [Mucilaginibacter sp.]|nr:putative aldouronate transport system permease protein [Mucilaginibacter sp.]